jgi:glyoxylase-like metal-dependent hydrolase (beta-lactamase superfamily II)
VFGNTLVMSRRTRKLALAGCAFVVMAVVVAVAKLGTRVGPSSAHDPHKLLPPGVHILRNDRFLGPSAAYVVETSDGLVLVDSGLQASGTWLSAEVRRRGLDIQRLRIILLTHAHGDHSLGAEYVRQATGAKIYAGRDDCQVLRAGGPRDAFFSTFPMPGTETHPTNIDAELSGGEVIQVGDARFSAIAAPGHTPGSICYLLERGPLRIFFGGDVIIDLPGSEAPLGTYAAYLAPRYRGDAQAYLATLQKLQDLPAPDFILPGHPDSGARDYRMTAEAWRAMLRAGVEEMQTLRARFQTDGANFLDGVAKKLLPDLYYLGDFEGFAIYYLATPAGQILFDAPGGPGLPGFIEKQLRKLGVTSCIVKAVLLTSANPESTSGLKALVEKTGCKVVALAAGLQAVKGACPHGTTLITEAEFGRAAGFTFQTVPLQGRGTAPVAYVFRVRDKKVLLSGRIPVSATPRAGDELLDLFSRGGGDGEGYFRALQKLDALEPDLWLPLVPEDGQNAFLYGLTWPKTLEANKQLAMLAFSRKGPTAKQP